MQSIATTPLDAARTALATRGPVSGSRSGRAEEEGPWFVLGATLEIGASLSDAEIAHAELARERSASDEVRDFADMLVREHAANTAEALVVFGDRDVAPIDTPVAADLRAEAATITAILDETPRAEFDRTFLDQQITLHAAGRTIVGDLDDRMLDQELARFWIDTREIIGDHLDRAIELAEDQRGD